MSAKIFITGLAALSLTAAPLGARAEDQPLAARAVAVGIPGAAAVAQVGYFHAGGPIRDKPEFAAYTQPGRILDPKRVLVTSTSNFGAASVRPGEPEGAVLSIDAEGGAVLVPPPGLAGGGIQSSAADGRIQFYTGQSPAFANAVTTPGAATAAYPAVSNPLGLSINNAFGRLWFANAPAGATGEGTLSITDPGGMPLAGAPSKVAGGIFAGDRTNRRPQQAIPGGLNSGGVATSLIGMSPDGSKRAVFALLTADGALLQAHTEQMVDGLAPAGTVSPLPLPAPADAPTAPVTRAGMLFNWVPDRILYVSDPVRNAVLAIKLTDDGKVFRVDSIRRFEAPEFSTPVDLAPTQPEIASPGFASNTMLAGGSDLYVLNRGNGTVVRMTQTGRVVAVRKVSVGGEVLGARRLNGIATSADGTRLWLTVSGALPSHPDKPGGLIEVPAFGPGRGAALTPPAQDTALVERGRVLFAKSFTPAEGLGPLFDKDSCLACHSFPTIGGTGPEGIGVVHRVGRFEAGKFDAMIGKGGPVARQRSVAELGVACGLSPGMPAGANLVSVRNANMLFGAGLLDAIPDNALREIAATQAARNDGVAGRVNVVKDATGQERVGRLGWKGNGHSLAQFVADAMRNELGLSNPLAKGDLMAIPDGCGSQAPTKDDGTILTALTAYIAALPPPAPRGAPDAQGAALFNQIGCAACHQPSLSVNGATLALYSDLLLHDMGPALDDNMVQGQARGRDWKTAPLWGLGSRIRFLHDGRATTLRAAITAHDGEATRSVAAFRQLPADQQERMLGFLASL